MKSSSKKPTTDSSSEPEHPQDGKRDTVPMPSLVFNEVRFDDESKSGDYHPNSPQTEADLSLIHRSLNYRNDPESPLLPTNNPPPPQGAWGYIWLSVAVVMIVVVGVWIYALPGRLSLSSWQQTGEYKLLSEAQNRWGKSFSGSSTAELLGEVDVSPLAQAIAAFNSTSTSSSTASTTTTSTTTTLPGISSSTPTSTKNSSTTTTTGTKK